MQFSDIQNAVKKFIFSLFGAATLFIIAGIVFFFGFSILRPDGFMVLGGNFDTNYRKFPFDQKSIDFTLSSDVKLESIKNENFEVSPKIDGVWSLKNSHTLSYTFGEKIKEGESISFTLKSSIESKKGERLPKDYTYDINVVSSPRVIKITPSGNLENLSQNIAVFFNIPMVPLTSLEKKDTLPCPLEITPKLLGKCQWTTSSVLEFIPQSGFEGATKYTVTFKNVPGLLYTIGTPTSIEIVTPSLKIIESSRFTPGEGIPLDFNFGVDQSEIQKNVEVYGFGSGKIDSDTSLSQDQQDLITPTYTGSLVEKEKTLGVVKKIDYTIVPKPDSQNSFFLIPKVGKFGHLSFYKVMVKKGLMSKLGNIALEKDSLSYSLSYSFLQNLEVFRNLFSQTGALIDTRSFGISPSVLPVKNVFFQLNFEQEIATLDTGNFLFQTSGGQNIGFDIQYIKEPSDIKEPGKDTFKTIENKKRISLTLKSDLLPNTQYNFIVKKQINPDLGEDIIYHFQTPPSLAVSDFKFVGYAKTCLYFNNPIDNVWDKKDKIVTTSPASKISSVTDYEWIPEDVLKFNDDEIVKKGYCPNPKNGNSLYILSTRMNPNTEYTLSTVNTLNDMYGNTLALPVEKKVKTGQIEPKDKYLYISLSKEINVIPSQIPITINLQTVNLDNVDIDICEMSPQEYMEYTVNKYTQNYEPHCSQKTRTNLKVKDKFWTLSSNKFDLENDILKRKITSNIVLVRGYKDGVEKDFENTFIKSNLSLVFEKGGNKSLLFVSDFLGAFPNEVIKYNFFNYNYDTKKFVEVFPKYTLNKEKNVYEFSPGVDFNYALASSKNYFSFLSLSDDSFSDYDFKYVGGVSAYEKNYLYLYTDRPIYKPGDTVQFKGLLRQFDLTGYKKSDIHTGKLQVLDENNKNIISLDISLDKNSNFNGKLDLPKDISLGKMTFLFTSGENFVKNDAFFHVEEYVKPPFKIDFTDVKSDSMLGESMSFEILPTYYFGGKLTKAKGQYSILTQNYFFDAKEYSNFQFGEDTSYFDCVYWGYCQYNDILSGSKDFSIDENGKYTFSYDYPVSQENGEKIYSFNFDVTDPDTGNVVSKTASKVLHDTDGYVGLDVPYWNASGKPIKASVVTLDYNATALPSKKVNVELYSRVWKSVKKQGVDGVFYDDYSLDEKKESENTITTDGQGVGDIALTPKGEGEYRVKVTYTGANGKTFHSSSVIYISSDQYINWNNGNNDVTDLVALKTLVKLGDTASYVLKSPVDHGKVLLTVEKDDGIIDYFIHDLTSFGDKIDIPVKDSYYPNYYVRAFIIGSDPRNPLPVYKRALTVTKVVTDYKKLKVDIKTDKAHYIPGDTIDLQIHVTNSQGKPVLANGSISIVDESVLALKGNPKKNPYAFFYDMKRYLGTFVSATLKNLIEKLEVKDIGNGEKGGAGDQAKGGDSIKKRGNFKDTAFWQSDFNTDANGDAHITTSSLPDNLTTWVIETLVNSPDDNKIGINYTSVTTTQKLLIQDNLPSFFVAGDKITLAPQIFNKSGKDEQVELSLVGDKLHIIGDARKTVLVKDGDSTLVPFDVEIAPSSTSLSPEVSKITFTAKTTELTNALGDAIEKTLPIIPASTGEAVATAGKTQDVSFDEHIDLSDTPANAKLSLHYSPTLMSYVTDGIEYLNNYPYGCSEQKTSSVMPNIYIKKLYSSVGKEFDLKTKMIDYYSFQKNKMVKKSVEQTIQDYLVDIRKFQNPDGGFVYFYDADRTYRPNYSDFYLSSYILSSGGYIKDIGYVGEPKVYTDTISYLKNRFYKNHIEGCTVTPNNDCTYSDFDRLNAIDAMLMYNKNDYEAYKMWKLLKQGKMDVSYNLEDAVVMGKLATLKDVSETEKKELQKGAKKILDTVLSEELVFTPRGAYIGKSLSYSRLANTALFLEAVSSVGIDGLKDIDTIVDNVNRWLVAQKKDGGFGSTQDTIHVIRALTAYIKASRELDKVSFLAKFHLNGTEIESKKFDDTNKLEVFAKDFTGASLQSKNIFNITKDGNGTLYYDFSLRYDVPVEKVEARDEGFAITQDYFDYNEYKKIDSLKKEEWIKYTNNEISYNNLKYPKSVYEYLTPVASGAVGQLLVVRNKLITSEARDKVAFESFIPSGSQIINPNLDTSTKSALGFTNDIFEKSEYRLDRYFGYATELQPGIYDVAYLIRLSNKGSFVVKPTKAYEFYNTEVFGRDAGRRFEVK